MNLNLPQLDKFAEAPQSAVSMEKNKEIASLRWKPTKRQKVILKELFREGDHNPTRARINEITELLKFHGNVEAKNVFYWFQNSHARNKRKQQRKLARNQNETSGSSRTPICSSPSRAPGVILERSLGLAQFSLQNNGGLNKQEKQKKSTQNYSFDQENIARRFKGPVCPSLNNASMWEPPIGMATFPLQLHYNQRHTNSPESAFRKEMEMARPNNLPLKLHLQSAKNETVRETVCGITLNDIRNKVDQRDGSLRPSKVCTLCPYTESRLCTDGCNILIPSEAQNKAELLELFPLHPDGNLRSLTYCSKMR